MNQENRLLLVLAAIQFTHIMDFMIMMPLGPQLMRIFEISPQEFSFLVSSYTFTAGAVSILAALVMDKFDRRSLLSIAYIGFTVGTIACAFAESYWVLLLTRSLTGAFGGILGALVFAIIGDAIPLERRATAMGKLMASFSLASVIGVPSGLFIATKFSWHAPFLALGAMGVIITVFIFLWVPRMRSHLSTGMGAGKQVFQVFIDISKNPNQLLALLLMICLMLGQFTIIPFISPYMVSNVGFTEAQLTYIYLVGGGLTIFTSPLVGKLADRFGRLKVFSFSVILSLIPLLLITHMPPTPVYLVLMVSAIFFVLIGGRMIPAMTMITAAVQSRQRGGFMSVNSAVQQIASGFASFLAGLIVIKTADGQLANYHYVGYIAVFFSLITLFIARKLKPAED
jgi:MFS transporter, DHA1 family, inner membrane transport protein